MLNEKFILQLKSLYKDAFPTDSANFVEYFFSGRLKNDLFNNVATVSDDKQLVSAGYIIKKPAKIFNKQETAYYLTALATFSEHRNKGYFTQLMQKLLINLYDKQVSFCFLYPFNHEFYLKYNFNNVSFCDKIIANGNKKCIEIKYTSNSQIPNDVLNQLATLDKKNDFDNRLTFGKEEILKKIGEFSADNVELCTYAYSNDTDSIFAYCFKNDKKVFFYVTNDKKMFFDLDALKGLEVFDFNQGEMPYIQARIVNIKTALQIAPLIIKKPFSIKIVDNLIKDNNAIFLVTPKSEGQDNIIKIIKEAKSNKLDFEFNIAELTKILLCGDGALVKPQRNCFIDQY
ncbi:MAG: GNAT family N-acetyltransferase [Defluviitaleaceae bacterium]|nr:GNAT family N-acetyltransferase [Defluviitaleaceae bacterium]